MDRISEYFPHIFIVACFAWVAYRAISNGGFRGMILGGRIDKTVGEIPLQNRGPGKHVLRVHRPQNGNVAVEITSKAALGFHMTGFNLPKSDASKLAELLRDANGT